MIRFRREPDEGLSLLFCFSDRFGNVRVFLQHDRQRLPGILLDLCFRCCCRPVIRHSRCLNHDILLRRFLLHDRQQVRRRFDCNDPHVLRYRRRGASLHKRHLRAPVPGRFRQCKAHFPAGIIGQKAHGVQPLPGGSGGDEHLQPRQIVFPRKDLPDLFHNLRRFAHPPGALVAAGQDTRSRAGEPHAPLPQGFHVLPRGLRGPHAGVHGRGDQHRCLRRQHGGAQHVVRDTAGHLGQDIRRRRRDYKHVRQFGQRHVLHVPVFRRGKSVRNHRVRAQGLKRQRRHKLRRVFRHDYVDAGAQMTQTGDNLGAFIRRDASRNAQHNVFAGPVHFMPAPPDPRGCHRSAARG